MTDKNETIKVEATVTAADGGSASPAHLPLLKSVPFTPETLVSYARGFTVGLIVGAAAQTLALLLAGIITAVIVHWLGGS